VCELTRFTPGKKKNFAIKGESCQKKGGFPATEVLQPKQTEKSDMRATGCPSGKRREG